MIDKDFLNAINSGESIVTPADVIYMMLGDNNEHELEEIADMLDLYVDSDKDLTRLENVLKKLYDNMHDNARDE